MKTTPNPMRSLIAHGFRFAVLLLAGLPICPMLSGQDPAQAQAQALTQPSAPPPGLYRIAGTVTNSVTGEKVIRTTVSLVDETTREPIQSTETGSDGSFALEPVPAAKYGLRVARRGYFTSYFDEHDEYSSAIVTGEGQDTEHIPFQLSPGGMVHGVVTDDAGEPVENAKVFLFRKARYGGRGDHLLKPDITTTDDTGGFELWDLLPGAYYLAVKAEPWFAMHPSTANPSHSGVPSGLDVAYPVTYYDGTIEQASAASISIAAGDRVELNVPLHAVPAIHLLVRTGEDTDASGQVRPNRYPALVENILSHEEEGAMGKMRPGPPGSGMVEISGIAPGHYELRQDDPPRTTVLDASGNQEVDASTGTAMASVKAAVRMSDGSPPPEGMELLLDSDSDASLEMRAPVVYLDPGNAAAHFSSVGPGGWTLLAQSGNLALAVVSVQTQAGLREGSGIQVKDRPLSITATVAMGKTRIQGMARKDGRGLPGVMIVLVPRNAGSNRGLFRRDQSDSDGSFALRDVVPGQYTIVAIEDGWELEWARPEVMSRYLAKGVGITITQRSDKLLRLALPVQVQPR